jgi:hypothetical protein
MPSSAHLPDPLDRDGRLTALVDALSFRSLDPRLLPLSDELPLHLGHHPQHGHEDWPRRILGREGGFEDGEGPAFSL